jgi:hypothetical protein
MEYHGNSFYSLDVFSCKGKYFPIRSKEVKLTTFPFTFAITYHFLCLEFVNLTLLIKIHVFSNILACRLHSSFQPKISILITFIL